MKQKSFRQDPVSNAAIQVSSSSPDLEYSAVDSAVSLDQKICLLLLRLLRLHVLVRAIGDGTAEDDDRPDGHAQAGSGLILGRAVGGSCCRLGSCWVAGL